MTTRIMSLHLTSLKIAYSPVWNIHVFMEVLFFLFQQWIYSTQQAS